MKQLWAALIGFALFGCNSTPDEVSLKNETIEPIVIFIEPGPDHHTYSPPKTGGRVHQVRWNFSYGDAYDNRTTFTSYKKNEADTVIFYPTKDWVELEHVYQALERWSFILKPGDTVKLSYPDSIPTLTHLNGSIIPKRGWEFPKTRQSLALAQHGFLGISYYSSAPFIFDPTYFKHREREALLAFKQAFKDSAYANAAEEHRLSLAFIDSITAAEAWTPDIAHFYRTKVTYQWYQLQLEADSLAIEEISPLISPQRDSLLAFGFYQRFVEELNHQHYEAQAPLLEFTQERFPDYRVVYDLLTQDSLFSEVVRQQLLSNTLGKIIIHFDNEDIATYVPKHATYLQDSTLMRRALEPYRIKLASRGMEDLLHTYSLSVPVSRALNLKAATGEEVSFLDYLAGQRGRLVYVDFWASWCGPCFSAMPYAHMLKEDYADAPIDFVYVSIDQNENAWKRASAKLRLDTLITNFIVDNDKVSALLRELELTGVPRYILYDEEGTLIHTDAPGPYGPEVRKLFDSLLKQEQ